MVHTVNQYRDAKGVKRASCSCGARSSHRSLKRFLRRHPSLCSSRREFAKQLAATTRHLDDLETNQ